MSTTLTLTHSLAHDPRTNLEMWLKEAEKFARNLCPQHDPTGALTLVATDLVFWHEMPVNVTNPADVLRGDPPQYCARPTWNLPAQHAANVAAAVVSIYKQELARYKEYTLAESTLATALLASIGETNAVLLKTTYPAIKTYALTPRQIVDTMIAKHGIRTSDDVNKLREPLSRALTSLSVVGLREPHGKLAVGLAASDTERSRGNPVPLFRALSPNSVGFPLGGA
jgi:hypothetical protein